MCWLSVEDLETGTWQHRDIYAVRVLSTLAGALHSPHSCWLQGILAYKLSVQ